MADTGGNAYEAARQRRIDKNRQQLAALGLAHGSAALGAAGGSGPIAGWVAREDETAPLPQRQPRRRAPESATAAPEPSRVSSRKRRKSRRMRDSDEESSEDEAPAAADAADGAGLELPGAGPPPPPVAAAKARVVFPEPSDTLSVVAPFTLRSIGVTVWDTGSIQRDSFATRFWSSKGCLFHHAYPVGFRAAKRHFGRAYTMHIVGAPCGPIFRVVDDATGEVFDGESPTKPWTAVCVSKRLGTRISGPLFFGFSDPLTQRAIAQLYTPEELAAARAGSTVASRAPGPEEVAAAQFCTVEGLGEATALALALTRQLAPGGARLAGLAQLQELVRADGGEGLTLFLTQSLEVSEATRRWPLWPLVFVPKIVAALVSSDPTAGKENRAANGRSSAKAARAEPRAQTQEASSPPITTPPQTATKTSRSGRSVGRKERDEAWVQ